MIIEDIGRWFNNPEKSEELKQILADCHYENIATGDIIDTYETKEN